MASATVALAILHGCVSAPAPPRVLSAEAKAQFGVVGLASARFPPAVELRTPAKGALPAAARKAVRWAGKAGGAVAEAGKGFGGSGGGYGAAAVFLVWMGALAASTIGGAAVGAVAGAVTAVPADTVRQAEAALSRALSSLNQDELRARVLRLAQQGSVHEVVVLPAGPSSPHERLDYSWVGIEGVDSVLEISVLTVVLAGEWDVDPPVTLTLAGATRLVQVRDGTEIDAAPIKYVAGTRAFTEWAADEARVFREELDGALDALAELIADRYFVPGLGHYRLNVPEG